MSHKEGVVSAKSVVVNKERVGQVNADAVRMTYSGAKVLHADELEATASALYTVAGSSVSVESSAVGVVQAKTAELRNCGIFAMKASVVRAPDIRTVVMNAGDVQGNVQTVFDRESALFFGAGLGAVLIVWRLIKGLFGR